LRCSRWCIRGLAYQQDVGLQYDANTLAIVVQLGIFKYPGVVAQNTLELQRAGAGG